MILGMSIPTFTLVHVVLSLAGIAAGLVVLCGLLSSWKLKGWTALFLWTTLATSITGFMFPLARIGPPHVVGAISLIVLAVAFLALYSRRLAGHWRWIYVATAVLALYLNVFVGVVQAFQKLPFVHRLAPTQSEPPFVVVQFAVLLIFVALGFGAARRFRPPLQSLAHG
jgi:hypothetical protein